MKLNNIFKKENLFETYDLKFNKKIHADDVVGISFCVLKKYYETQKNTAILAQNLFVAEQIRDILVDFVGNENVIYLPSEELIDSEFLAASPDIKCDRISGLLDLLNAKNKIIIFNVATALRFYPNPVLFKERVLKLSIGKAIKLDLLREKTLQNGYIFQNIVEKTGDFSCRGDIFDIYPFGAKNPVRIEFFDDEIESIREFSIEKQESTNEIDSITITPATELILSDREIEFIQEKLITALGDDEKNSEILSNLLSDIERIKANINSPFTYRYFSLIQDRNYSIFDYFECEYLFVANETLCNAELLKLNEDAFNYLYKLQTNNKAIKSLRLFFETFKFDTCCKKVIYNDFTSNDVEQIQIKRPSISNKNFKAVLKTIENYKNIGYKIYIIFDTEQQQNFFRTSLLLEKNEGFAEIFNIENDVGHLSAGFDFEKNKVLILSSKDIFGIHYSRSSYSSKFRNSQVIKSYEELKIGDYVVHEKYGIGIYRGINKILVGEIENDYITIDYQEPDKLHVPLEQFSLIRKYIGREGFTPKLSKLFSRRWDSTKAKVLEKIDILAEKLAGHYRERELIEGFAFPEDDYFQIEFERKFPYQLTKDQEKAVEEIKFDMESSKPMNRLICGDVGFGKTEVAFRAAFKCINSGKQVLLLCPTTLLAKQHYQRALERFSGFGVNVSCLTRFLTSKEFKEEVKKIEEGKVHFVIGTHKALSKQIEFKDLGLMIIDEEQRFGVEQKETVSMEHKNIDMLTLSATPIPRTLQQALVGMKSISIINTAPNDRNPIQTYLIEHNPHTIYELIARELGRNGQVYYVHNDVNTINDVKLKIESNLNGARVAVVHGQMLKKDIEDVMHHFYSGDVQVLIATTIIENGIDVARANLIIIENADKFGLAQLYQLKGRVGRSNRLAYAFLTYNPKKQLDEIAEKRLKSIQEFTELGSGYKIAQRDLMIRGAGDILGREQAGFIDDVGIDLYLKMLNDAIARKEGKEVDRTIEYKKVNISGFIPDSYANQSQKFEIYKWIDECKNMQDLQQISNKIKDIYGKIPAEMNNILKLRKIKIKLLQEEFKDFNETKEVFTVYLSSKVNELEGIGAKMFMKFYNYKEVSIGTINKTIKIDIKKGENYLDMIYLVLKNIDQIYNSYFENETR